MTNIVESFLDGVDTLLAWLSTSLKQTTASYCELQTADSPHTLVAHDGALISLLRIRGVNALIGKEEFERIQRGLQHSLQTTMSRPGHTIQVFFTYNKDTIKDEITSLLRTAKQTAEQLQLELDDLFKERTDYLAKYCAQEDVFLVLWTKPTSLTSEQSRRAAKEKQKMIKQENIPAFRFTQNLIAAIPDLRESHDSFVRAISNDFQSLGIISDVLEVHEALMYIRQSVDSTFTDRAWRPFLPGDKITIRELKKTTGAISDILWPPLAKQLLPRDAENLENFLARDSALPL